jgi:hypothetical protein
VIFAPAFAGNKAKRKKGLNEMHVNVNHFVDPNQNFCEKISLLRDEDAALFEFFLDLGRCYVIEDSQSILFPQRV